LRKAAQPSPHHLDDACETEKATANQLTGTLAHEHFSEARCGIGIVDARGAEKCSSLFPGAGTVPSIALRRAPVSPPGPGLTHVAGRPAPMRRVRALRLFSRRNRAHSQVLPT